MLARSLIPLLFFGLSQWGAAATYKWVDDKGVTHYGDTIPPEYTNKGTATINKRGVVIKKTEDAPTEEQKKAAEAERLKRAEQQRLAEEQRHRDGLLLETYTTEEEIDRARARALEQPDGKIALSQERLTAVSQKQKQLEERLSRYREDADRKKAPPPGLMKSLEANQTERNRLKQWIAESEKEKAEIAARFESDKLRFRELKTGKAESASLTIPDRATATLVKGCFEQWEPPLRANQGVVRAYVVGSDLVHRQGLADLNLDVRIATAMGDYKSLRVTCPIKRDGSIDFEGTGFNRTRFFSKPL